MTAIPSCIDTLNLLPDSIYSYKIQAWNLIGHSKYSDPKIVRTPIIFSESNSEIESFLFSSFSFFGITAELVQAIVTLLTLGGLVYAFFAFSLDNKIYNHFSGTVTETIVTSSSPDKNSNIFTNWFMTSSNSETVEVPKRRRHRERPKESAASMLAPEPSVEASNPTIASSLSLSNVLNSHSDPLSAVGIPVSTRTHASSNAHVLTPSSSNEKPRGLTRGLSLSMMEKKIPGESDLCFKCNHEFGFKDIKDISLNIGKWFRVRHFCSVCNRSFCSNCGKTSHKMAPCPVHGSCICAECDDLMTNSALKHVKRSDSGNSQSSQAARFGN